jgi:ferredoxin--NADP+ reductase
MSKENYCKAELLERIDISEELALFKLRPDTSLSFKPGQYATVALEDGDKMIQRAYSIVSSPYESVLEFFIELVPEGKMTPSLWDLNSGDKVWVRNKIVGHFTLDIASGMKRHLMIATVTGGAPFISMVRTQKLEIKKGKTDVQQFLMLHGASHSWELGPYKDELTETAREDWFNYIPTVSRPWEDKDWKGETGRVDDLVRKYADEHSFNYTNSISYVCGHPQMIENVKGLLARAHFPKEHIKEEKYFTLK